MSKIILALSGGIDSAVAGLLLKQNQHQVKAIYLNLQSTHNKKFDQLRTQNAQKIADYLDIPLEIKDIHESFFSSVIEYYIHEYTRGKTPNPCAVCNQKIKFKYLLSSVTKDNYDYLATGHYARKIIKNHQYYVAPGTDNKKSQEYFLALLSSSQISRCRFPLSEYTKVEVKEIASNNNIPLSLDQESQDLCFVGDQSNFHFLSQFSNCKNTPGKIYNTSGQKVGEHSGIINFTIGQRKKINVAGPEPFYVKEINYRDNSIVIGLHHEIFADSISINLVSWRGILGKSYLAKIRYRHNPAQGTLIKNRDQYIFTFNHPQWAPAPGQLVAIYDHDQTIVGAGFIEQIYF